MNRSEVSGVIFLDLKKAFDLVDHNIMMYIMMYKLVQAWMYKLGCYLQNSSSLPFFKSYLEGRTHSDARTHARKHARTHARTHTHTRPRARAHSHTQTHDCDCHGVGVIIFIIDRFRTALFSAHEADSPRSCRM